jgi:hypothetical protein
MLDECKGDNFFEVLALFSTAVLKKVLAAREEHTRLAVARDLATAPMLSTDQQRSLLPLAIAHKAALVNVLRRKEVKRRRYTEFETLLDAKADDIHRRIRKCKDTPRAKRPAVSQRDADAVKKQLADNWIGNPKWLDVMLHGDDVQAGDAFLHSRFDKVWRMVECGRKLEDVAPEIGLLESLQSRVEEQQGRLQKWTAFHQGLQDAKVASSSSKPYVASQEFKFDEHMQYQLPSSKRKHTAPTPRKHAALRSEYQDVLNDMTADLASVSARPTASLTRRHTSSPAAPKDTPRALKPQLPRNDSSMAKVPALRPTRHIPTAATPTDSEATPIGLSSTMRSAGAVSQLIESPLQDCPQSSPDTIPSTSNSPQETSPPVAPAVAHHSPSPESVSTPFIEPPALYFEPPELDPEEALAEQIANAVANATPSPVKKAQPRMSMSLMERTRMTMSRTTSFDPVPESPLPLPTPQLPEPPTVNPEDRRTTLLERTRLSMMAMQSKPRVSLAPKQRRESRQSLFPVNQFDTPRNRKSFELVEEEKSAEKTPKEVLLSDEVDYDRVFKSRPRIATSPVFSPPQHDGGVAYEDDIVEEDDEMGWEGDGDGDVTGIDLGDVDRDYKDGDDGFTGMLEGSPSRRGGQARY